MSVQHNGQTPIVERCQIFPFEGEGLFGRAADNGPALRNHLYCHPYILMLWSVAQPLETPPPPHPYHTNSVQKCVAQPRSLNADKRPCSSVKKRPKTDLASCAFVGFNLKILWITLGLTERVNISQVGESPLTPLDPHLNVSTPETMTSSNPAGPVVKLAVLMTHNKTTKSP